MPKYQILLNHLGFEPGSAKQALIQAPAATPLGMFSVYRADTRERVMQAPLQPAGTVARWGAATGAPWHYWRADLSGLDECGEYFLAADGIEPPLVSHVFAIQPRLFGELLLSDIVHYIKGQRCTGLFDLADRSRPKWGGQERRDVHGGWYDASGDCSKYLSHLSFAQYMNPQQTPQVVWNLIDGWARLTQPPHWISARAPDPALPLEDAIGFASRWFNERLVDEALHGADFLVRLQDPQGYFYMTVFDQWSKDPNRRDICEYKTQKGEKYATYQAAYRQGGGMAIAALARAAGLPRDGDGHTRAEYLWAARSGFTHLEAHNLTYLDDGTENIIDDYCALLAATELLAATGEGEYADAAARRVLSLLARQQPQGWFAADAAGERSYFHAAEAGLPLLALMRFLEVAPDSPLAGRVRESLRQAFAYELAISAEVNNPFGYPRQYVKQIGKPGRAQFFIPHDNESGYWWQGENARLGSIAAAYRRGAQLFADETQWAAQLAAHAQSALDWVLGANPYDACMLQGWGRNNPRYEPGYFNAPGGVCNGVTGGFDDDEDIDFRPSEVATMAHSWRWTEQWMPHGAWLFLALSIRLSE
ncbi:glycoside hydrolase family 9 protein [Chitiniphilus purpureus]|uniref:Glycoside hydrolase family 9 protein n=1 Tax=Chitiniphilus purpureus TaxID=2981137 RepID=A0ABY6DIW5_9NEIS|nr:glycoside hydrolase family 9 protein [Chitiniphilus sp. CD1]UXY14289.1 glycoside hydrolase family 9 protein [Chitiniphilus sp. CD1]